MDEAQTPPPRRDTQAETDAVIAAALEGLPREEGALLLATFANRAATRLHAMARAGSADAKGTPEWPAWAQLGNAARDLILKASTCRDLAAKIAGRRR